MLTRVLQVLSKLGAADVAGEIGVIFNIPQPFTMRTKRLSQVIRMSHHHFKLMVQPESEDGKTIISNFIQVLEELFVILIAHQLQSLQYLCWFLCFQYLKGLKQEMQKEIPFLMELLRDMNVEVFLHL